MKSFSPRKQTRIKLSENVNKETNSPNVGNKVKQGMPSFLRHSPSPNPEGKGVNAGKISPRIKIDGSSARDLDNKLGEISQTLRMTKKILEKPEVAFCRRVYGSKELLNEKQKMASPNTLHRFSPQINKLRKKSPTIFIKRNQQKNRIESPLNKSLSKRAFSPISVKISDGNQIKTVTKAKNYQHPTISSSLAFSPKDKQKKNAAENKTIVPKNSLHHNGSLKFLKGVSQSIQMNSTEKNKVFKATEKIGNNLPVLDKIVDFSTPSTPTQQGGTDLILHNFGTMESSFKLKSPKEKSGVNKTACSSTISMTAGLSALGSIEKNVSKNKLLNNSKQKSIKIGDFAKLENLGYGKYSEVFLAVHKQTGFIVAIKQISKEQVKKFNMVPQIIDEIRLHSTINHPNIIKFYCFLHDAYNIYFILQYVQGGSLFDMLNKKQKLSLKEAKLYLGDVAQGVKHLHQRSIAHRDLKPENILIVMGSMAKICDLGWATIILTPQTTFCGTFDYVPPEILQRKQYDLSVDIWCVGILTYELLTGKVPYSGNKQVATMNKINNIQISFPSQSQDFPSYAKSFIKSLLKQNPQDRPKCKQLLEHEFFGQMNQMQNY